MGNAAADRAGSNFRSGADRVPRVPRVPVWLALAFVLPSFAANSLLCRMALGSDAVDAASFSSLRLGSAVVVLLAIYLARSRSQKRAALPWDTVAALCLVLYSTAFAWAYAHVGAAVGGVLLFATVQLTLVGVGVWRGERLGMRQWIGFVGALAGGVLLMNPRLEDAPGPHAWAMVVAGLGWAGYTLRGARNRDNTLPATLTNFTLATGLALLWQAALGEPIRCTPTGALLAVLSGAVASACAYVVWYWTLSRISTTGAAMVQLLVPPLTAAGAVWGLGEEPGPWFWGAGTLVLVSLVLLRRVSSARRKKPS